LIGYDKQNALIVSTDFISM